MNKKRLVFLIALIFVLSVWPMAAAATEQYSDVSGHWAQSAIERWSDYGIVQGSDGKFDPDGDMTRAQAATVFSKLLLLEETADISAFSDVPADAWFAEPMAKCYAAGILNGISESSMNPNGSITREMFFVMFARAMGIEAETELTRDFADAGDISDWAKGGVYALINHGYVNGLTETSIVPGARITRASVMALLDQSIAAYEVIDGRAVITLSGAEEAPAEEESEEGGGAAPIIPDDVHTHAFTQKITEEQYFAFDADCTHGTRYYYSCSCGQCGTKTFEVGDAPGHSFAHALENDGLENLVLAVKKAPTNAEDGIGLIHCDTCCCDVEVPIPALSPEDYIVVPYIESTGNEYLDSGINVEYNDSVIYDVDMQFLNERYADWGGANGYLQFYYGYVGHCNRTLLSLRYNLNSDHVEEIYDNGESILSLSWTNWIYPNIKIGFFSLGNYYNSWWNSGNTNQRARLYGAAVTKNGYVAGCFVPVINAKTGETGLYNAITQQFIGNAGNGGNFVLPEGYQSYIEKVPTNDEEGLIVVSYPGQTEEIHIPIPAISREEYLIVPYIESSGNEYIDTGLKLSYNDSASYTIDYQFLSPVVNTVNHWAGANWLLDFNFNRIGHSCRTELQLTYNSDGTHDMTIFDDGTEIYSSEISVTLENVKIGIFRLGNANNTWWYLEQFVQNARCYGGHVEIDGKQCGIYLPVVDVRTGEAGLYDVISGTFLGNVSSSGGTFTVPHEFETAVTEDPEHPGFQIETHTCIYCGYSYSEQVQQEEVQPEEELPEEYTRLEYIRTTGTQYIDTGFSTTTGMIARYTASIITNGYVVGSISVDSPYGRNGAYLDISNGFWQLGFGETFPLNNKYERTVGKVYHVEFSTISGNAYLKVDGNLLISSSEAQSTSPTNVFLFSSEYHRYFGYKGADCMLYSCQIYNSDQILVRNFVPVLNQDGVAGLFDTVTQRFYSSDGADEFEAGPKAQSDYTFLPYIESHGQEYIDTGFSTTTGMIARYTASLNDGSYIVGSHSVDSPYGRNSGYLDASNGFWVLGYGETALTNTSYERVTGKVYTVEFSTVSGNAYLKVDGNLLLATTEAQSTSPNNVCLFSTDHHRYYGYGGTACKLYSCQIYNSDQILVRDFVPAMRNADGVLGFYDRVTKQFFENEGGGEFSGEIPADGLDGFTVLNSITFDGEHHIQLAEQYADRFDLQADSLDGKEVQPGYYYGYRLGTGARPSDSKIFAFSEMTSYRGDAVLHHYIPVMRNSNQEVGVYDTVKNMFYPLLSDYDAPISAYFFTDSSEYHPEIAELAARSQANIPQYQTEIQQQGYTLVTKYIEIEGAENSGTDSENIHRVPYTLYQKEYAQDGELYHLYLLSIWGTTGENEWSSNFTMGNNASGFHDGFEKGADFILGEINQYIADDPEHNKIIISGFSRGAAAASIISAKYMEQGTKFVKDSIYTYALACPNYSSRSVSYDNIFQICNAGDMVTHIPLSSWGFRKEGVLITLPNDSETVALLDSKLRQYQRDNSLPEIGYTGFTEDISSQVNLIGNYISGDTARNPNNIEAMTRLFYAYSGEEQLNLAEVIPLLFQLNFNGDLSSAYNLAQMLITAQSKNSPSHDPDVYLCWIEIMDS